MGYRIEYDGPGEVCLHQRNRSRHIGVMTAAFFLLFCTLMSVIWPEKWNRASQQLVPGDPAVTKAAFSQMTRQLREGEDVYDAVFTFCREVVDGAALSD